MTDVTEKKHAIVLASGGVLGAYEIGVMKALFKGESPSTDYVPLLPQIVCGSSIGAFNAAFIVSQVGETDWVTAVERLECVWLEAIAPPTGPNGAYRICGNPFELLDVRNLFKEPTKYISQMAEDGAFLARDSVKRVTRFIESTDDPLPERFVRLLLPKSFTSTEPFRRLIGEKIDFRKIRESEIELKVVATNWDHATLETFTNEDMTEEQGADIIIASGSLPGFFPHVQIGDHKFADAGVLGYASWWPSIEAEADMLHVVYTNPRMRNIADASDGEDLFDTIAGLFVAIWDERKRNSVDIIEGMNKLRSYLRELVRTGRLTETHTEEIERYIWRHVEGPFDSPTGEKSIRARIASHLYSPTEIYSRYHHATPLNVLLFGHDRVADLLRDGREDAITHKCPNNCLVNHGGSHE